MPGDYPSYHSLVHILAKKILTRVIKGGVSQGDAIKDVIHYAELNRQQIIHLCAVLQEYGQPYNGDPMDFFYSSEDLGKAFPNTPDGYVVYANQQKSLRPVFNTINDLKKEGFTSAQIVDMNPELKDVVETMDDVDKFVNETTSAGNFEFKRLFAEQLNASSDYFDSVDQTLNGLESQVEQIAGADEQELQMAAKVKNKNIRTAQEAEVEEATPDNLEALLDSENADEPALDPEATEDFEVSEDLGGDMGDDLEAEVAGGEINAKVTHTPSALQEQLAKAPEWSVDNILSIQAAENHLENVRKQLEAVVFDENIMLDADAIKQYDGVRASIDGELEKIKDAQKETEKLEDKQNDLEEEFQVDDAADVPTEELISEEAPEETVVEEEFGPAPQKEELSVSE